jgi:hypothetical protein
MKKQLFTIETANGTKGIVSVKTERTFANNELGYFISVNGKETNVQLDFSLNKEMSYISLSSCFTKQVFGVEKNVRIKIISFADGEKINVENSVYSGHIMGAISIQNLKARIQKQTINEYPKPEKRVLSYTEQVLNHTYRE